MYVMSIDTGPATPEVIGQAEHALNVNAKVLYEYEKVRAALECKPPMVSNTMSDVRCRVPASQARYLTHPRGHW
jgi:hypothetical protein